jgi:choline dehydrogenase-like flavoprotein
MRGHDFIVVGAGTAGCVLAARLSEDANARVLLLEAGSREPLEAVATPWLWTTLLGSSMDWADETTAQEANGFVLPWPRGRGLGGSSAINAMAFTRGHRSSYDQWVPAGAQGWGFDDLLPFFKRSEQVEGRDPALRGVDGPMRPGRAVGPHPISHAGLAAALEAGYPRATDISGGLDEGFDWCDMNIVDGRRQTAADAYLTPALDRPNLDVVTDALVYQLIVTGNRCTGVRYRTGTETHTAESETEVLLAAGTVGSPLLLMASGIGPQAHLREVGVDVAADLPGVGANLHDHPYSGVVYHAAQPVPVGNNSPGEVQGMLRTGVAGHSRPDIQIMPVSVPLHAPRMAGPEFGHGYTIMVSLMAPYSRGSVRLSSAAPGAAPVIDPRYYTDSRDIDTVIAGLRIAREIGSAPALAPWRGVEALPGVDIRDDEQLPQYVRESLGAYHHYAGTCRIGIDETAVVDTDLRVRGIDGLRVVDASVMPEPLSSNTNATVYAIAERAASLIRA